MEDKPNYYSVIPANVRYDKRLRDKAKLLYGEITALSNKNGYCYASNKYFANLYEVSTTTISTLIKELIDNGYLESELVYKEGSKEILYRYLKLFKEGIKENLKDNNTSINSNNNYINNNEADIFEFYEKEIGQLSPSQYELLNNYSLDLDASLIKEAIKITVNSGVRNMNYLKAVLKSFKDKGYKYINDLEKPVRMVKNDELEGNLDILQSNVDELEDFMNDYYK